ncbi:MAG: hypothetical protein ACMZ64_12105 [Oleiphilus sp.]
MKTTVLACFMFVALILSELASAATISRLQFRLNDNQTRAFTQSVFHSFWSDQYILQIYDREQTIQETDTNERFELYLGSGLPVQQWKSPLGIVARVQKWSSREALYSAGLMLNLNRIPLLSDSLKAVNARTFFQLFAKTERQQLGDAEILHYYQFNEIFGSPISVRGYNILHMRDQKYGDDLFQAFSDFIYPLHPHWDVYYRWSYVSEGFTQLGNKGHTSALGVRFNF